MSSYNQTRNDNPFLNNSFSHEELSADYELSFDYTLGKLRQVSSSLIKNNFVAAGIIQTLVNTMYGGNFIFKVINSESRSVHKKATKLLKRRIKRMTYGGDQSLYQVGERHLCSMLEKGDILVNLVYDKEDKTVVELVEGSRIRTPVDKLDDKTIVEGVQYDSRGAEVGYWVKDLERHGDFSKDDYTYLPKYRKFAGGKRKVAWLDRCPSFIRANQTRQVPFLTPGMGMIRYFVDYLNTTMIQARVSATFSGFIKTNNKGETSERLSGGNQAVVPVGSLKPGMIWMMNKGEDISFASPSRPSDNTDQFIRRITSLIAMTYRIPHETLFLDLKETSYLAWKGAVIEFRKMINRFHRSIEGTLKTICESLLLEMWSEDNLTTNPSKLDIQIQLPQVPILDEEKTARANNIDINTNKTRSRQDVIEGENKDFNEVFSEIADEEKAIAALDAEIEVLREKVKQETADKFGIIMPEDVSNGGDNSGKRNTSSSRRKGEQKGDDLTEEEKKERRKTDGNW